MEWRGIRFTRVEAESRKPGRFSTMSIKLDVNDMVPEAGGLRIMFSYAIDYKPDIAFMKFDGHITLGGKKSELDRLEKEWRKNRTIPKSVAEPLINIIKFNAETNGVLVAKAVGIVPPLLAPKMEISPEKKR